jgi:hypothetical protein
MDRTIARLNIEHYKRLLERETDGAKRQTILLLLAEEEAKLPADPDGKKSRESA